MKCPTCGSTAVKKNGFRRTMFHGDARRYQCLDCKRAGRPYTFYGPTVRTAIEREKEKRIRRSIRAQWNWVNWVGADL